MTSDGTHTHTPCTVVQNVCINYPHVVRGVYEHVFMCECVLKLLFELHLITTMMRFCYNRSDAVCSGFYARGLNNKSHSRRNQKTSSSETREHTELNYRE